MITIWGFSWRVGGVVKIKPENPVVRPGDLMQLICQAPGPVKSCIWKIKGELNFPQKGAEYEPISNFGDGECGIEAYATEKENGQWTCKLLIEEVDHQRHSIV